MKTLREILLARHKTVEPKLDAIRENVVKNLNNKETREQSFPSGFVSSLHCCSKNIWLELIWPARRVWTGLAVIWLLILTANFAMRGQSEVKMAKSLPSPEVIIAFRQQQQLLNELIGPDDPPNAEAQKTYLPRPASERGMELLMT